MPLIECILFICLAGVAGAAAGYLGARFQDRFRLTGVQAKVVEITDQARKDAENIRKEQEQWRAFGKELNVEPQ